ncbi:MAG: hypothetical protein AAF772_18630, partial [Acidobacteriota bacterium]
MEERVMTVRQGHKDGPDEQRTTATAHPLAAQLAALDRRFYRHHRDRFDHTRRRPWRGWQRLLARPPLPQQTAAGRRLWPVLDVGCGNGRFAHALCDAGIGADPFADAGLVYCGLDGDLGLLARGRARLAARYTVFAVANGHAL